MTTNKSPKNIYDKLCKNYCFDFIKIYKTNGSIKHIPLKEYNEKNIIIFDKDFYTIKKKLPNNELEIYETFENSKESIKISCSDINLETINNKELYNKIYDVIKFIIDYNNTIYYLKKRSCHIDILNNKDINNLFCLKLKTNIKINTLNKIRSELKKTHDYDYDIKNLFINPYKFIQNSCSYISFNLAEKIEKIWELNITFETKLQAKIIDIITIDKGGIRNSFWIDKYTFYKKLEEYCKENLENLKIYEKIINKEIYEYNFPILETKIQELGNEKMNFGRYKDKSRKDVLENHKSYYNKFCIEKEIANSVQCVQMQYFINYCNRSEKYITTKYLLNLEKKNTEDTINLYFKNNQTYEYDNTEIYNSIEDYEKKRSKERKINFKFDNIQKNAIIQILNNNFAILIGPPGSGKTDIVECVLYIISIYEDEEISDEKFSDEEFSDNEFSHEEFSHEDVINISIMAPTGQAFNQIALRVLSKYYYKNISGTCHKILYNIYPKKCELDTLNKYELAQKKKYENLDEKFYKTKFKFIIVDEFSMINLNIYNSLLKICKKYNSKLLIIGDTNQLEPIGPGNPLGKLIESKKFTVCKLSKIYRQKENTNLLQIIEKMNGQHKIYKENFNKDETAIFVDITNLYTDLKNYDILNNFVNNIIINYNLNKKNTKFLCYNTSNKINADGTKKYIFNVPDLNNIIQNIFNPISNDLKYNSIKSTNIFENKEFRIKDKIVRTENDYSDEEKMRANGEEASIEDFDGEEVTICYSVDIEPIKISINKLFDEFDLNYTTGFHKSQGGGWDTIVIFIEPNVSFIKQRSIYTSISRSKDKLIFISTKNDLLNCQRPEEQRISLFMDQMFTS